MTAKATSGADPMAPWPFRCPHCNAPARTLMGVLPADLSPRAQEIFHWRCLTRRLTAEQVERLREILATSDLADTAFRAAFQTPTLDRRQRRRAHVAWLRLSREAVRGWRELDGDAAAVHIDEELAR
jgi:hypothetical protein